MNNMSKQAAVKAVGAWLCDVPEAIDPGRRESLCVMSTHAAVCSPVLCQPAEGCNSPPCLSEAGEERLGPFPSRASGEKTTLMGLQALTSFLLSFLPPVPQSREKYRAQSWIRARLLMVTLNEAKCIFQLLQLKVPSRKITPPSARTHTAMTRREVTLC